MPHSSKILVTGSAGFIGFHLVKALLKEGHQVVGIDNLNDYYDVQLKKDRLQHLQAHENFTFYQQDIAERQAMEALWAKECEIKNVVHLAAQAGVRYSLVNPYAYLRSNIDGHLVLLELCRHRPGMEHFVYASSSSVYGNNPKIPFSIKDRCDTPISLYAATKKANELMSHAYAHLYQFPVTGLRFFTVYGPWGRPDMSAFVFTKAILEGRPIQVFNQGQMKRDYTYVDDIVAGVIGVLEKPSPVGSETAPNQLYNLGNHQAEPLMKFIGLIEECLGKKAIIEFQPMQPGDVPETFADIDESTKSFGFKPKVTIEEGVPRLIKWYREYYKV